MKREPLGHPGLWLPTLLLLTLSLLVGWLGGYFYGMSTFLGLFNTEVNIFCKQLYLIQIIYTKLYDLKYSSLIQIICTQLHDTKYSYSIQIICALLYDIKYSYLIQIIYAQLYGIKYTLAFHCWQLSMIILILLLRKEWSVNISWLCHIWIWVINISWLCYIWIWVINISWLCYIWIWVINISWLCYIWIWVINISWLCYIWIWVIKKWHSLQNRLHKIIIQLQIALEITLFYKNILSALI